MPSLNFAMTADNNHTGFSQAIGHEKNERVARSALGDMLAFQKSLEADLRELKGLKEQGTVIDEDLLHKMTMVNEQYHAVMAGFSRLDDDSQRHALIVYADAVQDLITYLHRIRGQ